MKKKVFSQLGPLVIIVIITWQFTEKSGPAVNMIKVPVKSGQFVIAVTTTGELEAENSERIRGPENLRSLSIFNDIKINDLVPEGTIRGFGRFCGRPRPHRS